LQPFFHKLMRRWFYSVWAEDMEMRERRLKVWRLGFRDFVGLGYVNNKTAGPDRPDTDRPYPIELPVPKITDIARGGVSRPVHAPLKAGNKFVWGFPEWPEGAGRRPPLNAAKAEIREAAFARVALVGVFGAIFASSEHCRDFFLRGRLPSRSAPFPPFR